MFRGASKVQWRTDLHKKQTNIQTNKLQQQRELGMKMKDQTMRNPKVLGWYGVMIEVITFIHIRLTSFLWDNAEHCRPRSLSPLIDYILFYQDLDKEENYL